MTIKEAAECLGISRSAVYERIRKGLLHPRPLNPQHFKHGPVRIPRAEVLALLRPPAR